MICAHPSYMPSVLHNSPTYATILTVMLHSPSALDYLLDIRNHDNYFNHWNNTLEATRCLCFLLPPSACSGHFTQHTQCITIFTVCRYLQNVPANFLTIFPQFLLLLHLLELLELLQLQKYTSTVRTNVLNIYVKFWNIWSKSANCRFT